MSRTRVTYTAHPMGEPYAIYLPDMFEIRDIKMGDMFESTQK